MWNDIRNQMDFRLRAVENDASLRLEQFYKPK